MENCVLIRDSLIRANIKLTFANSARFSKSLKNLWKRAYNDKATKSACYLAYWEPGFPFNSYGKG